MSDKGFRVEKDSMGELKVPEEALWGAQTQRAVQNFPISGLHMPRAFIRALGMIKWSAAAANRELGLLDAKRADAIQFAAEQVAEGRHDAHFPVDVFQTGSGTSSNMNANEVIARLASEKLGEKVHPNDDVNMGQSSNDVIPTAIHVSAAVEVNERLLPSLRHLAGTIERRAGELASIAKTGRTHLMDAMPVRFDQTMGAWATQVRRGCLRVEATLPRLYGLAQGGTAVGTGINAHEDFADSFARHLSERSGLDFFSGEDKFELIATQDTAVELSGQLKVVAVSLMKISNDLRWMNSGPLAGLGEITLPALQPGSSIMPGKINPVIAESVCMLSAQVIGNDATITVGGQSGNFELNVMLPVIAYNLLQSIELLANGSSQLADSTIAGFKVNEEALTEALEKNPILVTSMNHVIGYEKGAAIAKKAYAEGRPIRDVAREATDLSEKDLDRLLDAVELTKGGIKG